MRTVALIVAAAAASRSEPDGGPASGPDGDGARGLLAPLAGRPVAEHALAAFEAAPEVDDVLLLAPPALAEGLRLGPGTRLVAATGPRAQAVSRVIETLGAAQGPENQGGEEHGGDPAGEDQGQADRYRVLIHDAACPLIGPGVIAACVAALASASVVCAAVPASDTMVRVDDGFITDRPRRDRLRRRQYPQGFHLPVIRRGYRLALADPGYRPADDCAVVLRYLPGVPVRLVPGSEQSFPVTSPLDVEIAETILRASQP